MELGGGKSHLSFAVSASMSVTTTIHLLEKHDKMDKMIKMMVPMSTGEG